ncbi:MAG TPA: OsmC family protein [Candidatus Competibacter sp.]|nr:OsmC family protein [Candidatus Competibacteraceae bacterium]HRW66973.1 OsmC family protein [Candidatus Competibacter sp.]
MKSTASALWEGDLKQGQGHFTSTSGVLQDTPYSFRTRFEGAPGTNPEELIAAAHAGCFSMALSMILGEAGLTPQRIATEATVTLDQKDGGFAITQIHLDVRATVPGASDAAFQDAAGKAKIGCPVSKVLHAEISMNARLDA